MDKILRAEVNATIRQTLLEALEVANEEWLTKEQLCETFPMFTPSWIKNFGVKLPREKARVSKEDGSSMSTRYQYPKHKINRLIAEGYFRNIAID